MTAQGCAATAAHPSLFDLPDAPALPAPVPAAAADGLVTDPTLEPDARAERRFWRHVIHGRGCWWWVGAISTPDGYGRITYRRGHRQRAVLAHRFALMLDDPDFDVSGAIAEHHCNEPLCVRVGPGHLAPGSQATNLAYAVTLGRAAGPRATSTTDRAARSIAIRSYLLSGGDPSAVHTQFTRLPNAQLRFF
ncbi:MAG: hypothetical protein INR66_18470 [Gordonia polyisoprenivorans]|nr:hypothetical protein [Gordonia polyisoprenivorans]